MGISSILLEPDGRGWAQWLARPQGRDWRPDERKRQFRQQVGLPVDRPLVMTGHQAAFWHPGILAKYLAASAAAERFGAAAAAVVVDQDTNDFEQVRFPVRIARSSPAEPPRLKSRSWRWHPAPSGGASEPLPTASVPAHVPAPPPALGPSESFGTRSVADGLAAIRTRLNEHAGERSAARQVAAAVADLLQPMVGRWPVVLATEIAGTDLFRWVVEAMAADPVGCIRAYNAAVTRHPGARMTALAADDVQYVYELPLWRIDPSLGGRRRRVYAEEIDEIPFEQLAPRAALMTGLLRLGACEVFVAGTGGGGAHGYERVAEEWLGEWLGETLAPEAVVSATVTLEFDAEPIDPSEAARARWRAHRALSDPSLLGDEAAGRTKMEYVRRIAALPRGSSARAREFAAMHDLLERVRNANRGRLDGLARAAGDAAARLRDNEVLGERTWPFPLYPAETLEALQQRIRAAFD